MTIHLIQGYKYNSGFPVVLVTQRFKMEEKSPWNRL